MGIVESFLAAVLIGAGLDAGAKTTFVWVGVGMFVVVVAAVFALVWFKPSNLTFDKHAHLIDRGRIPYGTPTVPADPDERLGRGSKGEVP